MPQGSDGLLIAALKASPACVDAHNRDVEKANSIVSEFHEQSVPEIAAQALDRLYGSLYASFSLFCVNKFFVGFRSSYSQFCFSIQF